jgi:hypothetical protein
MKKIFTILLVVAFAMPVLADDAPKTKKVCKTDSKTKKETCKTIKIHKKLEGTKVPTKK